MREIRVRENLLPVLRGMKLSDENDGSASVNIARGDATSDQPRKPEHRDVSIYAPA